MKNTKSPRSGFTLIELLTVIAIIGILAAILIPAVGKVREVANKTKSSSNIRSIALAYATYSSSGGRVKTIKDDTLDIYQIGTFLAEKADLTDSSIWLIPSESAYTEFSGSIPPILGYRDEDTNEFVENTDPGPWESPIPVAYAFAVKVSGNAQSSTTPLTWTRGLLPSGIWGPSSPWGFGGHIAYLDGHVVFYDQLDEESTDGEFLVSKKGKPIADISQIHPLTNVKEYTP